MNLLSALYFPETAPQPSALRRLLLFFDRLTCLRPMEQEPPCDPATSQAGLVQEYAPAPLGAELRKFQQFIDDVRHHGAEHAEGLLAALSYQATPQAGDDAMWSIVSSISKKPVNRDDETVQRDLWQARFILKIAELHAATEQELLRELTAATSRKQAILQALHGEESEDLTEEERGAELLEQLGHSRPASEFFARQTINEDLLLTAWMRLLLHDQTGSWPELLATASAGAAATLLDRHEALTGEAPWRLGRLSMPAAPYLESDDYLDHRQQWRTEVAPAVAGIGQLLRDLQKMAAPETGSLEKLQTNFTSQEKPWEEAVSRAGSAGPEALTFYLLPHASLGQLAVQLAKTKKRGEQLANLPPHTLLAVLA